MAWISAAPSAPRSTAIQRLVSISQPTDPSATTRAPPTLPMGGDGGRQRVGRLVIERAIQVAEHAQSVLTRRFRNQPRDVPVISHEHDLFLIALHGIENSAEVAGHLGDGKRLHAIILSD